MSDFGETILNLPLLQTVTSPVFLPVVSNGVNYRILLYPVTSDRVALGAITGSNIANGTIGTSNIANGAITSSLIDPAVLNSITVGPGSIGTTQLAVGAVTSTNIASQTIAASNIANGAVGSTQLAVGGVATSNLASAAVTGAKIATATITTSNLANGAVTAANIANNAVGTAAIQAAAVGTSQILDGSVTSTKLSSSFYTTLTATLEADTSFLDAIVAAAPFEGLTALNSLYGSVTLETNNGFNLTVTTPTSSTIVLTEKAGPLSLSCFVNSSTGSDVSTKTITAGAVSSAFATVSGALTWFENNCSKNSNISIVVQTNVTQGTITCRYFNKVTITNDPNAPTFYPVVTIVNSSGNNPSGVVDPYAVSIQCNAHFEAVDFSIGVWANAVNLFVVNAGTTFQQGASAVVVTGSDIFNDLWYVAGTLIFANTALTARAFSVRQTVTPTGTNLVEVLPNALFVLGDLTGATTTTSQVWQQASGATFTVWLYLNRGAEYNQYSTLAVATAISQSLLVGTRAYLDTFSRVINAQVYTGSNAQMFGATTGTLVVQNTPTLIPSAQLSTWQATTALPTY